MRGLRRAETVLALIALGVAASLVVLHDLAPRRRDDARSGVPQGQTTTAVQRRTLTERTQVDGTLGYAGHAEIYDHLSGTVTWLPAAGSIVRRGGTLFRIDDAPVALMYGSVPAYRVFRAGISDGPDVRELNDNLAALGFDASGSIAGSEHFGDATVVAVERWQRAMGLERSGEVELGRVQFTRGPRRVATLRAQLGEVVGAGPSEAASASAAATGRGPEASAASSTTAGRSRAALDARAATARGAG